MKKSRRNFIRESACATAAGGMAIPFSNLISANKEIHGPGGINPWLEISKKAYWNNVDVASKMAKGKPVLAVLKNNAYGIGDIEVSRILDGHPQITGIALVKEERALAVRNAGVKKPILLMGDFDSVLGKDLVESNITLSVHSYESLKKIQSIAHRGIVKKKVQLYIDTGLGRMGMPYHQAYEWGKKIAAEDTFSIGGVFTTLTSPIDFANEQLDRFNTLVHRLKEVGIHVGKCHAAPSQSILDIPGSHLDMVRPGILLHGSLPSVDHISSQEYSLQPSFRLKARVIRIEKLRKGDTVGFSRFYTAKKEEWIATIPIGWADGYDSRSENGAKVLVGNQLFPVINVNASHCNLLLGKKTTVKVGDIATLIGPDPFQITPKGFAESIKGHNYLQINFKESIPKYVQEF